MKVIPVVHVRRGELVRYDDGGWTKVTHSPLLEDGVTPTPQNIVPLLSERYGEVYWVDVDGQKNNEPHLELIRKLSSHNLWVDASPCRLEDAMDLFVAGANRLTIRPSAMHPDVLHELFSFAEGEIYIGLETRDGVPLFWDLSEIDFSYAKGVVAVEYGSAGTARGVSDDLLSRIMETIRKYAATPLYFAGGVRKGDLSRIEVLGYEGALVGTSIIERGENLVQ